MGSSGSLSMFDDTVAALDQEFAFLVDDYGFQTSKPERNGREYAISYYLPPYVELAVTQEPLCAPFLLLYVKPGILEEHWKFTPLRLIGRKRKPEWIEPVLAAETPSDAGLRAYFKNYADLLQECFQDVLSVGRR